MDPKLQTWKVDPDIPAGFQREVWARIAARGAARRSSWRRWLPDGMELWKPQCAVPVFALALASSIGLALFQAREANDQAWKDLESRYAVSFNPIAQASGATTQP